MFLLGTFYLFASFLVMTCISVIFSKNPVNSVLFLVLAFLNSTFLFILIGAEFVGIILAIVYIGAVAILFLFVVMMLDIQITTLMYNIKKYVPLALLFAGIILAEYANMILMSSLTVILFLGGWYPPLDIFPLNVVPGIFWFALKVFLILFVFLWVRATFPRYRYDQLMRLGWKIFLPLTLIWVVITSSFLFYFGLLPN